MFNQLPRLLLILSIGCACHALYAQEVIVKGAFLQDSAQLGDQVDYYLVAKYPSDQLILFPDSTFQFEPFEYSSKKYFQTRTTKGISYDSAVYRLYTFDISEIQFLALPVFLIGKQDSIIYETKRDSLFLKSLITEPIPDSTNAQNLPLKTNTLYERVYFLFNYPIVMGLLGSLLIISLLVWVIFGKRIRKYFKLKKLYKTHAHFQESFSKLLMQVKEQFAAEKAEKALSIWKKYLEQLEHKPYTKLTTKETISLEKDEKLGTSLKLIDKAIYGHDTSVLPSLEHLHVVANDRFMKKIEEVKHG